MPQVESQPVQQRLAAWFKAGHRKLPWRATRDPYAIWVSEVMLQQTQVATAAPYFQRFMARFPTVQALADAPVGHVLKAWEGLGYYSRARDLHRGAGIIAGRYGGELPRSAQGLRKLPGIGRYTAGAIASIAFGRPEPAVDGNVRRVLCRVFAIDKDPSRKATQDQLWALAGRLVPRKNPGLFNQAVMELGATVCLPRRPRCTICPLETHCRARRAKRQEQLPRRKKRRPLPHHDIAVGVIWRRGRILIDLRPFKGLLGGLWEFPGGKVAPRETLKEALVREVREELGITIEVVGPLAKVRGAFSHFRITLHAFQCRFVSGRPEALGCAAWKWVRPDELDQYPFPKANQKIIALIREQQDS